MKKQKLTLIILSLVFLITLPGLFLEKSYQVYNDPGVADTLEIRNIYSYGQIPTGFGYPDTIRIQFVQHEVTSKAILIRTIIRNDSATGPVKDTIFSFLSGTNIRDTIIEQIIVDPGTQKTDLVIVEAMYGDGSIIADDTSNNSLTKCLYTTSGVFNPADPCDTSNTAFGFSGRTGNLVASFRNKGSGNFNLKEIEYNIFSSLTPSTKPFRIVIYGDNGSGKPGTLLHSSATLFPPNGAGIPIKVKYFLTNPIAISSGNRFYAGYRQTSTTSINASAQTESPVRPKSFFFSSPDTSNTWFDFRDSAKNFVPDISVKGYKSLLTLNVLSEGLFTAVRDTFRVYIRNSSSPYAIIDSSLAYDSVGLSRQVFNKVSNGIPYYIEVKHRNTIRIFSAATQSFVSNLLSYNFTISASQAFGSNMTIVSSKWCMYSGEAVKDGCIDLSDIVSAFNDASNFSTGYLVTDMNGDEFVDLTDILYCFNNSSAFVCESFPP